MGKERFTYNRSSGLNSIIFNIGPSITIEGTYELIDREEYIFGDPRSNSINLYGTFSHVNDIFVGGRYDYYTSIRITLEQYRLIKLVCLNDGWVSIK